MPGPVLQADQRCGNTRPPVEHQREPPERLGRTLFFARRGNHGTVKPACIMLYFTWLAGGTSTAACSCNSRYASLAMDLDVEALKAKLAALMVEHRDLDDVIARIAERAPFDQLQLQRLKKRKLALKDQISKIESELLPDIIA